MPDGLDAHIPVDFEAGEQSGKSYEWRVINGRLMRRIRMVPHERSVSARLDAEARDILPRFANEQRGLPKAMPTMDANVNSRSPSNVVHQLVGGSQPKHPSCRANAAINWTSGQLHLIGSASMPPSPKEHQRDTTTGYGAFDADDGHVREQKLFARPSNRSEAIQLSENLERKLQESKSDAFATQRSWQVTFCELVRQVHPALLSSSEYASS